MRRLRDYLQDLPYLEGSVTVDVQIERLRSFDEVSDPWRELDTLSFDEWKKNPSETRPSVDGLWVQLSKRGIKRLHRSGSECVSSPSSMRSSAYEIIERGYVNDHLAYDTYCRTCWPNENESDDDDTKGLPGVCSDSSDTASSDSESN